MDQDEVEVHKHAKQDRGQYPVTLTKQARFVKDLLHMMKKTQLIFR